VRGSGVVSRFLNIKVTLPDKGGILSIALLCLLAASLIVLPRVYAGSSVKVSGKVNFEPTLSVRPEKRVPLSNNWSETNIVEIRHPGTTIPIFTQVVLTNANGVAVMEPIDTSMLPAGTYDVAVKGSAHLREVFPNYSFYSHQFNLDLAATGKELKAGDTVNDNYINSLDLSYMIRNLYSGSNVKSDLNRDGVVNSLDVSNLSINLYEKGDQ
jgi:hypothetical protein